ncbi:hypothetical protein LTS16_013767 [Friedmanniomyces endolithicus]|nr:hypothetical protein LTR94_010728 [Friedmanniomyces endolithicus]KAK0793150.1 hypothetical protein LTR38_009627 [Friedmanniomyces endolithicus]KAK0800912.1 hypothetical protein LTR75_008735 [Friedmanniomyces endolithicus]KAK0810965.1 hypothetical protein LTR59_001976 [Friedmanniomyces endolithicus]KAK0856157.1 hypothetical protein LTS02_010756 [Friedmanniomyces endolithicus]
MGSTTGPKANGGIPKTMKALQYSKPKDFAVVEIDVPSIGEEDVLVGGGGSSLKATATSPWLIFQIRSRLKPAASAAR